MQTECITLIFSGVVTLSTVAYVILTYKLVKQTRLSREFFLEAYIVAYLTNSENMPGRIYLNIKNIGKGVARDVNFKIQKDIDYEDSYSLSKIGIFKKGIKFFPPENRYRYFLTDFSNNVKKQNDSISFSVSYSDSLQKQKQQEFTFSFDELDRLSTSSPPDNYIGMISYRLQKIEEILNNLKSPIDLYNKQ